MKCHENGNYAAAILLTFPKSMGLPEI
ncbi:hypothetical protein E9230_001396 [Corynebacterium glutamicum]|nr:hypothetical protein [Corynebacterium glutamicum]